MAQIKSSQELIDLAFDVDKVLRRALPSPTYESTSPLITWAAFHLGAARVAVGLVDRLTTTEGLETVQDLLSPEPFDVLEAAALSLSSRSVVTALDLCAASLYRISGGLPLKKNREADVAYWTPRIMQTLLPERDPALWVWGLRTSPDWTLLEAVRHGVTHRQFARTVNLTAGSNRIDSNEIHVEGDKYRIDLLVKKWTNWGEERFRDFCGILVATLGP